MTAAARRLIDKPKPGCWKDHADEGWFRDHEAACEGVIADFFRGNNQAAGAGREVRT